MQGGTRSCTLVHVRVPYDGTGSCTLVHVRVPLMVHVRVPQVHVRVPQYTIVYCRARSPGIDFRGFRPAIYAKTLQTQPKRIF